MAIDDKLEKTLEGYLEEIKSDPGREILLLAIDAVPYAGGAINRLLFGDAQRRVNQRAEEVFKAMKERLEEVEEEQVDKSFFETDEFMTLLTLAIEQLQTTHDTKKIQMLGVGLAQAGLRKSPSSGIKELFTRILRDLAPQHIELLQSLDKLHTRPTKSQNGEQLAFFRTLVAHGLVDEEQNDEPYAAEITMRGGHPSSRSLTKRVPYFGISDFGSAFLEYFSKKALNNKDRN